MPNGSFSRYLKALALCALATILSMPLRGWMDPVNIGMLFLLTVFIVAVRLGRGPAVMAACLCVVCFDFFVVPPHLSFSVVDAEYLLTLTVMLAVGLITSHLAAQLADKNRAVRAKEHEAQMLYGLARELSSALTLDQVGDIIDRFLQPMNVEGLLIVGDGIDALERLQAVGGRSLRDTDANCARRALAQQRPIEDRGRLFLPLSGAIRARGVLALSGATAGIEPLLEAVATLSGIVVERLHYSSVAQQSELDMQSEKLRSSILSSVSHDLRTPLTSLVGLADSLVDALSGEQSAASASAPEKAAALRDQAESMHRMVTNLLAMARLDSGRVSLNRRWQLFEEVVGPSVRQLGNVLASRQLEIDLPDDLPLLYFDAVLIERVLCNLLENAAKYALPAAPIRLAARAFGSDFEVSVCNAGGALTEGQLEQIFDPFVRGTREPAVPGTGIGLAVCRTIIGAHGGTIRAETRSGMTCISFRLPLGNPPAMEAELT